MIFLSLTVSDVGIYAVPGTLAFADKFTYKMPDFPLPELGCIRQQQ